MIGFIGGIIAVLAVFFFDKRKLDDPVGALSVHLANGIWGTISVGLFAFSGAPGGGASGLFYGGGFASLTSAVDRDSRGSRLHVDGVACSPGAVIKAIFGLRVEPEDESRGLDVAEMGMEAYAGDPVGHSTRVQHAATPVLSRRPRERYRLIGTLGSES